MTRALSAGIAVPVLALVAALGLVASCDNRPIEIPTAPRAVLSPPLMDAEEGEQLVWTRGPETRVPSDRLGHHQGEVDEANWLLGVLRAPR